MQTYKQILTNLKNGQYAPVYFLCGEEPYFIDVVCDYIENNVLDEAAKAFDQTILYGRDIPDANIAQVISLAGGFAMMGDKKGVILKEAQSIRNWASLGLYMKAVNPATILVICYKYGHPDMRTEVWKNFEKQGGVMMQADKLRDYQVEGWIRDYLGNYTNAKSPDTFFTFDPKIPALLAAHIGTDLSSVVSAVEKLVDGLPQGVTHIDTVQVERNIGISKDYNVFELQEALINGDILKANRITQYFASSKDHPIIKELGILFGFFSNLMLYHYLPDKNERAVAAALGINPFFVKDYAKAAKRYPAGKTFRIIGYFRETDARSKGINNLSADDDDLWKELIYKIMH